MDKVSIFDFTSQREENLFLTKGGVTFELKVQPAAEDIIGGVQWALDLVITDSPVISAPIKTIFRDFGLVRVFTTIDVNLEEKTPAEIYAAYDALMTNGIVEDILLKGNSNAIKFFINSFEETLSNIVTYRQSVAGVIDTVVGEAGTNIQVMEQAAEVMQNPQAIENVKELLKVADTLSSPQT